MGEVWDDFSICGECRQVRNFCFYLFYIVLELLFRFCFWESFYVAYTRNDVLLY